ncbi:hypothetical protein DSC45_19190 [Streptomyces sp. YIM 130001]|uniref:Uma2 family endonuclease n=1 Tax=Streptomyces sp. YIM 130001 TaxID=2259644 RepID=UPI000E65D14B|nr:Uma2 family endonuclease [Streptomyces sp. YIM 130001]RII15023.1 hypothetical protein DSC45_19190 [Streptomyces sp. YIM 130001]
MTAEPISDRGARRPAPPPNGYTVDDLFTLPDLPPHTELIDGSLVFLRPQRRFHAKMIDLLMNGLRQTLPESLTAEREMTVVLDRRNGPEPDVSIVRTEAVTGLDQTHFRAEDVVLAIEVVSPDSEARDRDAKPRKYAAAGIPHFWLVDAAGSDGHPVVHVYELDIVAKSYVVSGIHHEQLKTGVPFPITMDISLDALSRF